MDRNTIIDLLKKLQPEAKPLWGRMSAQHMVEHLNLTYKASTGKVKTDLYTPEAQLEAFKKSILNLDKELPRNFISPLIGDRLLPLKFPDLATAIHHFFEEADNFHHYYSIRKGHKEMHPLIGMLGYEEWEVFHRKHIIHHFKQFDLL